MNRQPEFQNKTLLAIKIEWDAEVATPPTFWTSEFFRRWVDPCEH